MPRTSLSSVWKAHAVIIAAAVLGGCCLALADARWRLQFIPPLGLEHWLGVIGLYTAVGGIFGVLSVSVVVGARRLEALAAARLGERALRWVLPLVLGLVVTLACVPTALWTFSGHGIGQTVFRILGPPLFLLGVLVLTTLWVRWVVAAVRGHAQRWPIVVVAVPASIACLLTDRHMFVSLYERLHTLLELSAWLLLGTAIGLGLESLVRLTPRFGSLTRGLAGVGVVGAALGVTSGAARDAIDRALSHAWVDPVLAGRMLRRIEELETYLASPATYDGIAMARLETLKKRYQLADIAMSDHWLAPPAPAKPSSTRQRLSQAGLTTPNVLVFYIDTLRNDVARDPAVMPNLARFAKQSLDFRRAYATGSDTLRSLPGITGGSYFLRHTHPSDLCELGRSSEHQSSLFIARSAHEFLKQLRPSFAFEYETDVADFAQERADVWGYGADQPTAERIVDAALERLKSHPNEKFFMWLFHFDQHNWRELDEEFVARVRREHDVREAGVYSSRYRAVATAIDLQFGRMLAGLEAAGRADDTVVILLSDHGEGLGDGGFWVHSVFLWESLVHVPLVLRVPGVAPRAVDDVVSLVDVAPTLAPFLVPGASIRGYHGEDLLTYADPEAERSPRRFPVLFGAALRDELVRVGMIEDGGNAKLVVRLEAAQAELHDLARRAPDDFNVASDDPARAQRLLETVAKSPVFPRELNDFRMLQPKGNLSLEPAPTSLPVSAGH